jgi:hypothetical protein
MKRDGEAMDRERVEWREMYLERLMKKEMDEKSL